MPETRLPAPEEGDEVLDRLEASARRGLAAQAKQARSHNYIFFAFFAFLATTTVNMRRRTVSKPPLGAASQPRPSRHPLL